MTCYFSVLVLLVLPATIALGALAAVWLQARSDHTFDTALGAARFAFNKAVHAQKSGARSPSGEAAYDRTLGVPVSLTDYADSEGDFVFLRNGALSQTDFPAFVAGDTRVESLHLSGFAGSVAPTPKVATQPGIAMSEVAISARRAAVSTVRPA